MHGLRGIVDVTCCPCFHVLFPCCLPPLQILKPADQKARFAYRGGAMAGGTGGGGGAR